MDLVETAIAAAENAYAPYSDYRVGAALESADGPVFSGCNVESAAYSPTLCAERVALGAAVAAGHRGFLRCVVATENGGFPCGVCRQSLYEFAPELEIIVVTLAGDEVARTALSELLPEAFGPSQLD